MVVPIKLPSSRLLSPPSWTFSYELPEITLPAPVVVPPIVLPERMVVIPTPLEIVAVPSAFVPIRFPQIRLSELM